MKLTYREQPERLREQLEEAGMTHGSRARVDIKDVFALGLDRSTVTLAGRAQGIFFCQSEMRIRRLIADGDGGPIGPDVHIEGLTIPQEPSEITLENVEIFTNGRIEVIIDQKSRVVTTH